MSDAFIFTRNNITSFVRTEGRGVKVDGVTTWSPEMCVPETWKPRFDEGIQPTKMHRLAAHRDWIACYFTLTQWKKNWKFYVESFQFIAENDSSASVRVVASKMVDQIQEIGSVRPSKVVFEAIKKPLNRTRFIQKSRFNGNPRTARLMTGKNGAPIPHDNHSAETCAICTEALGMEFRFLDCNHTFHWACMDEWIKTSHGTSCPLCRKQCDKYE